MTKGNVLTTSDFVIFIFTKIDNTVLLYFTHTVYTLFSQQHQYLYAITEQPNVASQKVLLKCGFKQDGFFMENKKKLLMFKLERTFKPLGIGVKNQEPIN